MQRITQSSIIIGKQILIRKFCSVPPPRRNVFHKIADVYDKYSYQIRKRMYNTCEEIVDSCRYGDSMTRLIYGLFIGCGIGSYCMVKVNNHDGHPDPGIERIVVGGILGSALFGAIFCSPGISFAICLVLLPAFIADFRNQERNS